MTASEPTAARAEPSTLFELIEDCADIPFAPRATSSIVPAPRTLVRWEVDDCCLAQVADIDDYP